MTQVNTNPLAKHFRTFRKHLQLPSANSNFIEKDLIEYDSETKEVGIMPMTAADEIMFKNPDALLNGEAVKSVIKSCVPAVKDPGKLLAGDVDFLLVAIKSVSSGSANPIESICPKCGENQKFELDLDTILATCKVHDESYPVNLNGGLTVFVRPYIYNFTIKSMSIGFQESKILDAFDKDSKVSEKEKLTRLSEAITKIADLNFDLVDGSIVSVVGDNGDLNVTEHHFITEFSENMAIGDSDRIVKELNRINEIGIDHSFEAICLNEECGHKWEASIDYNPTTFFIRPS